MGSLLAQIASLSDRVNWGALEAIGTVGALWFAVVQAGQGARLQRLHADGVLTTLIGALEPLGELLVSSESGLVEVKDIDLDALTVDLSRARERLDRLVLTDVALVGGAEWVAALPLAFDDLLEGAAEFRQAPEKSEPWWAKAGFDSSARYVWEAIDHLREQRDYLRYGRIGTHLRRMLAAWSQRRGRKRLARRLAEAGGRQQPTPQGSRPPRSKPDKRSRGRSQGGERSPTPRAPQPSAPPPARSE